MEYETDGWVVLEKRSVVQIVDDIIYFESTNYIFDKKEEKVYHQGPIHFDPTHQRIYDGDNKSLSIQGNGIIHFVYQAVDLMEQAEKALGKKNVYGFHVDNGFMRMNESIKASSLSNIMVYDLQ